MGIEKLLRSVGTFVLGSALAMPANGQYGGKFPTTEIISTATPVADSSPLYIVNDDFDATILPEGVYQQNIYLNPNYCPAEEIELEVQSKMEGISLQRKEDCRYFLSGKLLHYEPGLNEYSFELVARGNEGTQRRVWVVQFDQSEQKYQPSMPPELGWYVNVDLETDQNGYISVQNSGREQLQHLGVPMLSIAPRLRIGRMSFEEGGLVPLYVFSDAKLGWYAGNRSQILTHSWLEDIALDVGAGLNTRSRLRAGWRFEIGLAALSFGARKGYFFQREVSKGKWEWDKGQFSGKGVLFRAGLDEFGNDLASSVVDDLQFETQLNLLWGQQTSAGELPTVDVTPRPYISNVTNLESYFDKTKFSFGQLGSMLAAEYRVFPQRKLIGNEKLDLQVGIKYRYISPEDMMRVEIVPYGALNLHSLKSSTKALREHYFSGGLKVRLTLF